MSQTIQETIEELHSSLRDYIEATYHISDPALIEQRKELLNRATVIFQVPYFESTPRYQTGEAFSAIKGLPQSALEAFTALSSAQGTLEKLLYDPPYKHQSDAIRRNLVEGKNLLVMTGTGSGKTEVLSSSDSWQARPRGKGQPRGLRGPAGGSRAYSLSDERAR